MSLVMKFGGTSVGSAQAIRETAALITETEKEWGTAVVVASAMGTKPVKVTDLLLNGAYAALEGDESSFRAAAAELRAVHLQVIDELLEPEGERQQILAENERFIQRYEALCQAVLVLAELTPRALDAVGGMGEQMSVRILAAYLRQIGRPAEAIDATELIVTDNNFQAAAPLMEPTTEKIEARLRPALDRQITPIVTGFIAATENGVTSTLGRGGSDFTGAILGQALKADEVWIWTDVDGVMTADPRVAPSARNIPTLTYREVSELAYYGAKVLHPKTIRPCVENGIPLRIKNTFNPAHNGTLIVPDGKNGHDGVKGVTAIKNLSLITVEGKGMMGVPGIAARTFGAVAKQEISVLLISQASSEQSICFATLDENTKNVIVGLEQEFKVELERRDIDGIWAHRAVSIVTIVGAGMRHTPGIAGKMFSALGDKALNVIAIAQGSSECSISIVVDADDTERCIQTLHELIG